MAHDFQGAQVIDGQGAGALAQRPPPLAYDVLLREANHRCSNDLQLVISLLSMQAQRAQSQETREALSDMMERVAVLARSRAAVQRRDLTLDEALRHLRDALASQAEPRGILVTLDMASEGFGLPSAQITTLTLVVNELATNAIKHAFEAGVGGYIRISTMGSGDGGLTVLVDDDGLPFPELDNPNGGFGLNLVKRMVASIGGLIILPSGNKKIFEIRVPLRER